MMYEKAIREISERANRGGFGYRDLGITVAYSFERDELVWDDTNSPKFERGFIVLLRDNPSWTAHSRLLEPGELEPLVLATIEVARRSRIRVYGPAEELR